MPMLFYDLEVESYFYFNYLFSKAEKKEVTTIKINNDHRTPKYTTSKSLVVS